MVRSFLTFCLHLKFTTSSDVLVLLTYWNILMIYKFIWFLNNAHFLLLFITSCNIVIITVRSLSILYHYRSLLQFLILLLISQRLVKICFLRAHILSLISPLLVRLRNFTTTKSMWHSQHFLLSHLNKTAKFSFVCKCCCRRTKMFS